MSLCVGSLFLVLFFVCFSGIVVAFLLVVEVHTCTIETEEVAHRVVVEKRGENKNGATQKSEKVTETHIARTLLKTATVAHVHFL